MSDETARPSFVMSIDTRAVYDRMKEAVVGEVVSFKTLSEVLGRKVEGDEASIQSAIRKLIGEGVLFENVRKTGYKRLSDTEVVGIADREREGLRKKAKRAVRKLACVREFDRLPNELKIKHNAAMSGFGAIAAMMSAGRMKRLEERVEVAQQQLPLAKTLEVFRS